MFCPRCFASLLRVVSFGFAKSTFGMPQVQTLENVLPDFSKPWKPLHGGSLDFSNAWKPTASVTSNFSRPWKNGYKSFQPLETFAG
jgi:hypothetical protein